MLAAHLIASRANASMATALYGGAEGPRFCLAEVQALQDRAEQDLRLCKPWLPTKAYQSYQQRMSRNRAGFEAAAAASPGLAMLPARQRVKGQALTATLVACSGCGRQAIQLRKCSGCRQAAYFSRECQVRHWKEGGHRRECAQLAAAAGAGAGTGAAT